MVNNDADMFAIGQHCCFDQCQQLDFLPFTCQGCRLTFCAEHRTCTAHNCTKPIVDDSSAVIVCPLCAKAIKVVHGVDPNQAFEAHVGENCDPANYNRVHKRVKCPVQGCREKLTSINSYYCKACGARVCLKHRYGPDHQCRAATSRGQRASKSSSNGFFAVTGEGIRSSMTQWFSRAKSSRSNAARQSNNDNNAVSSTSQRQIGQRQQQQGTAVRFGSNANELEYCPHCGRSFSSIPDLIHHVESSHLASPKDDGECVVL